MAFKYTFIVFLLTFLINCNGQNSDKEIKIVDRSTGFTMNLPRGFEKKDEQETSVALNKGKNYVHDNYNLDIDLSNIKPNLFVKDNNNYFVLSVNKYDEIAQGNYNLTIKNSNSFFYDTYHKNFPNSKIDSVTSIEKIDNVTFKKFELNVDISSKSTMHASSYTALLHGNDFTLAAVYIDSEVGLEIKNAVKTAKFLKPKL